MNKNIMKSHFLSNLNIMLLESGTESNYQLKELLKVHVKDVYNEFDAKAGLSLYYQLKSSKIVIDAILCNIDLDKTSAIELLKEIRVKNNDNIPFIFFSNKEESKFLYEAINYNISAFLVKPLDINLLVDKLNQACHESHKQELIKKQQNELNSYLKAIDNVAIISKTDKKGNIIFVNDFFCELAEYKREELLNKPHNIVRHKDNPKDLFKELWQTVKEGNIWTGKIKNQSKKGNTYYVNSTVMPIFDELGDEIIEYIAIRFLTTEEELSKREFRKKVMDNIQESKKKEISYQNRIRQLEETINQNNNILLHQEIDILNKKTNLLNSQIIKYEDEIKQVRNNYQEIVTYSNDKISTYSNMALDMKKKQKDNISLINNLKIEINSQQKSIVSLQNIVQEKSKQLHNLKDVIKYYESTYKISN